RGHAAQLATVLPEVEPLTGKAGQPRIERYHQPLPGRLKVFPAARLRAERRPSAQRMAWPATSSKASTGSGRSRRMGTKRSRPPLVRAGEALTAQLQVV